MNDHFLRTLDDMREEQEALLERQLDPDMALISDYLAGELSEEENAKVRERLVKDPDFRDLAQPLIDLAENYPRRPPLAREELERRWLQLRRQIGLPEIAGHQGNNADVARLRTEFHRGRRSTRRLFIRAAAAAFVLFMIWPSIMFIGKIRNSQIGRVPWGLTASKTLPDGSHATLATGTRLVVIEHDREWMLSGEATFTVRPAATPFVVWTASAKVTVAGTVFTVHAYEHEPTQVSVAEGSVTVQARNEDGSAFGPTITLGPGQRARVSRGQSPESLP